MKPPSIEIDDTRSKLCEGRSIGIGFAFLKRMGENVYRMVQPLSPCKDYLNDVLYSEITGKPYGAWGLSTKKEDILGDDRAYLSFADCPGSKHVKAAEFTTKEESLVPKDLANMLQFMHAMEKLLGIKEKTELVHAAPNLVFAKVSKDWVATTYAVSLWSFLIRNAIYSQGGDPMAELEKTKDSGDRMYFNTIKKCIAAIQKNGMPKQDLSEVNSGIHDLGIISWSSCIS